VFLARDTFTYTEDNRQMTMTVDTGAGQAVVFRVSIGRWDKDPAQLADDTTRLRIEDNVRRALEWLGWNVSVRWTGW
jgi:hypothetical protein